MHTNGNPVRVRWAEFDRLTIARGWKTDAERARRFGVEQSTILNLRTGKYRPGAKVIDAFLTVLECPYASLFERETDEQPARVA